MSSWICVRGESPGETVIKTLIIWWLSHFPSAHTWFIMSLNCTLSWILSVVRKLFKVDLLLYLNLVSYYSYFMLSSVTLINFQEWLQVTLTETAMITGVITQGRYANGHGEEFAELVSVQVKLETGEWEEVVVEARANSDTSSKVEIMFPGGGVETNIIRVIPISKHPRMICLRIELLGCKIEGKIQFNFIK